MGFLLSIVGLQTPVTMQRRDGVWMDPVSVALYWCFGVSSWLTLCPPSVAGPANWGAPYAFRTSG
jgi:hypothetical protein